MLLPFLNLRLRQKILLFSILIASIPFFLTNIYWYTNAGDRVRQNAQNTLQVANEQANRQVESFLNAELLGFFSHSQGAALLSRDKELIRQDLINFLKQDPDIESLTFVDVNGQEIVKMDRQKIFPDIFLKNIKENAEFKVPSFYYGKEYIGPVKFNLEQVPQMVISVPVSLPSDSESLKTFSSVSKTPVPVEDISGILVGTINLNRLLQNISSLNIGDNGYIYVIDQNGYIIAYPDAKQIGQTTEKGSNTEIQSFLNNRSILTRDKVESPSEKLSIIGVPVLSTHKVVDKTNWATIVEEPVSSITEDIKTIQKDAYPLFLLSLCFVFLLSFLFARTLTQPILRLVKGTQSVGRGNFDYPFSIHTHDEIEELGDSYHVMAQSLKFSKWSLEHERDSFKAERNTFSTVLESITDSVIALNKRLEVVFSNTATESIAGIISSEIHGKHVDAVIHFKKDGKNISISEIIESSQDKIQFDKLQFKKGSEVKTIRLAFSKLPESSVSEIKYLITMYDLSNEQQLENMKLDFVSMAAHELRTPLTSIQGYLSVFMQENLDELDTEKRMFLGRIQTSTSQLMGLVENLLSVSRIEKGAFVINPVAVDWVELTENTVADFAFRAKEKNISLTFQKPPAPFSLINADKIRLTEVLSNLLANAISYTHKGGSVVVSLEETDDSIVTHVSDTGEGIPKSALDHLFTKFFRVSGYLSQGSKGTGLGLYISKAIVEMHKGKIWVESEVNKGSTFSFSIPKFARQTVA